MTRSMTEGNKEEKKNGKNSLYVESFNSIFNDDKCIFSFS